jgi:hypothetical protein
MGGIWAGGRYKVVSVIRCQRLHSSSPPPLVAFHQDSYDLGVGNKLTGTPLWELKPASRGGEKGVSRVYLFLMPDDEAGVVNCEVKGGVTADREKLRVGLEVVVAYKQGVRVFEEPGDAEEA